MKTRQDIEQLLTEHPEYRDAMFCRGYYLTEDHDTDEKAYPFYGIWNVFMVKGFKCLVHPKQTYTLHEDNGFSFLLIGHAYNPFSMCHEESQLLKDCAIAYSKGKTEFFDCINEWTGIFALFVISDELLVVQDCGGIKGVYYGKVNGKTIITEFPQIAADLHGLTMDPFIQELTTNRFFNIGNRYLPGDLSPFKEFRRLGANVYLAKGKNGQFTINRFYPTCPHKECKTEEDYNKIIAESFRILHNGIELASRKWSNGAISLSGGMDSKTTLACANGCYDKFKYYSYQSKDTEIVDSEAAHTICGQIGLKHDIYKIESNNEEVKDFDVLKTIIDHTNAWVKNLADNEIRKYIYFYRHPDLMDVEVKSWISEIVRVFFDRKYGFRMPRKLTPRHFSIFQTRYFLAPSLLWKSDELYKEYMRKFDLAEPKFNYEHTDLYYWEVRMSSWGMQVANSQDICHTITFPFCNRKLVDMMLCVPREKRITDQMHEDIIKLANPKITAANIHISNNYFKSKRIWLEKIYYYFRVIPYRLTHFQ